MGTTPINVISITELVQSIQTVNKFFLDQTQRQVNTALTLRNWVIGFYIVEYEQKGEDRAAYGGKLIKKLAERVKKEGTKGLSHRNLQLFKQFYFFYPQLVTAVAKYPQLIDNKMIGIVQTVSAQWGGVKSLPIDDLLSKLSFSHFIELINIDIPLKRVFYETEAVVNNWSVRELQRAVDSMLYERTGLSKDKEAVLEPHRKGSGLKPEDVFRSPYFLDFLGLEEKSNYVETDLEQAIINHLQAFLIEMGRGFCFEARQKRITFGNTRYRIDLVFYHRLLRCNVLIRSEDGEVCAGGCGPDAYVPELFQRK
jgi:predicted nuclease of restriction endonuclease-like (RecB) superfamily